MDLAMAQRLVDRRKAAGLSQEALAAQLGVSRQAVSKWERSESSPDTDNLIALAALYGVSLDELLYGEAANNADDLEDGSASTETADVAGEAEDSAENADRSDKPLVDVSLARGIHVIDPNKGEEVHVGWSGIHVINERKGEEVHVGPGGLHIDTLEDDGHSVHTNADGAVAIGIAPHGPIRLVEDQAWSAPWPDCLPATGRRSAPASRRQARPPIPATERPGQSLFPLAVPVRCATARPDAACFGETTTVNQ